MSTQEALISIVFNRLSGVYRDPSRVMRDAEDLLFSSDLGSQLHPRAEPLMLNDGTSSLMLMLQGTIPMTYRDVTYHIPIDMYLPPHYPARPPIVFVRPVPTMSIKANHKNVGQDGMVYMSYLHSWNPDSYDLTELASLMSIMFGEEPPCYARARPPSSSLPPPPPPYPRPDCMFSSVPPPTPHHPICPPPPSPPRPFSSGYSSILSTLAGAVTSTATSTAAVARLQVADRTKTVEEARLKEIEREVAEANLAVEAARRAEEQEKAEAKRRTEEQKKAEAKRRAEAEERARLAEERRRRIELERLAEERRRRIEQEEAAREAERVRLAEEARLRRERADAIAVATSAARSAMKDLFDRARGELRVELRDQKRLEAGRERIDALVREGEERKARLVSENEQLDESIRALNLWLKAVDDERRRQQQDADATEGKQCQNEDEGGIVKADLIAIPADTHSAQMLALSTESAAIDDCVYFLDMALVRGSLTLEVFLKEVRRLSKRQFLAKAHLIKIEKMLASER
ncbi:hypothetical protein ACHAW5_005176 [Stephanodiscus triporus]|uniref:UEV domain-containing protein n=1 Tax=Stephanodiscus triporus TaxID=2934178 RepID=A0ABD3MGI1_9STRA